jgi:hypothetical protein
MTTKQTTAKKKTEPTKNDSKTLLLKEDKDKSKDRQFAEICLSAPVLNSITTLNFSQEIMGEIDVTEALNVMREQVSNVNAGNLNELEATLTSQTVSLNAIFNELARRANGSDTMSKFETYMRLSLKAQSQCARTIEVLAAMKNPPIVYAKQANISHGNQQVNNGGNPNATHTEKIINQPNELLEANNGSQKMDGRTAQTAIPKDKAMATVAA